MSHRHLQFNTPKNQVAPPGRWVLQSLLLDTGSRGPQHMPPPTLHLSPRSVPSVQSAFYTCLHSPLLSTPATWPAMVQKKNEAKKISSRGFENISENWLRKWKAVGGTVADSAESKRTPAWVLGGGEYQQGTSENGRSSGVSGCPDRRDKGGSREKLLDPQDPQGAPSLSSFPPPFSMGS